MKRQTEECNPCTPDEEQLSIDAQVAQLEEEIRTLKTQRNARSPISRLPTEMLGKIFIALLQDPEHHKEFMKSTASSPLAWAKVTHISQHWRQTALGYPDLWARLSLSYSLPWIQAMLQRSGGAPLEVRASCAPSFNVSKQAFIDTIFREASRLSSFSLVVGQKMNMPPSPTAYSQLLDKLASPMPLLETLVLERQYPDNGRLPENLLGSDAPKLHCLKLVGWTPAQWQLPIFEKLTELKITSVTSWTNRLALSNVLEGLGCMPELGYLELEMYLAHIHSPSKPIPNVKLPHLRMIYATIRPIHASSIFFEHLALPASADTIVTSETDRRNGNDDANHTALGRLLQSLTSCRLPAMTNSTVTRPLKMASIHVEFPCVRCISIAGWTRPVLADHTLQDVRSESPLDLTVYGPIERADEILVEILARDNPVEFSFEGVPGFDIITHLQAMQLLELLHLTGAGAKILFQFVEDNPNSTTPDIFLPSLKVLSLKDIQQGSTPDPSKPGFTDADLLHFLRGRAEGGKMVGKVRLADCPKISASLVEEIRGVCADLEWETKW
ncbi:hypothetical protein BKA70DRAFT_823138 [Coprinopsis sp. MPI-PUGE-AT-0042]|nr:hypothetical protein BKA70DRAFT_823138 [Coprinopsis sp. MPI-PUGE-AT-0042]